MRDTRVKYSECKTTGMVGIILTQKLFPFGKMARRSITANSSESAGWFCSPMQVTRSGHVYVIGIGIVRLAKRIDSGTTESQIQDFLMVSERSHLKDNMIQTLDFNFFQIFSIFMNRPLICIHQRLPK
jgi:hypothetical protein